MELAGRRSRTNAGRSRSDAATALTEVEQAILATERSWWHDGDTKAAVIQRRLGMSPARYYRLLRALIDNPAAMAEDPLVVRRLRRRRAAQRKAQVEGRSARAPAPPPDLRSP